MRFLMVLLDTIPFFIYFFGVGFTYSKLENKIKKDPNYQIALSFVIFWPIYWIIQFGSWCFYKTKRKIEEYKSSNNNNVYR